MQKYSSTEAGSWGIEIPHTSTDSALEIDELQAPIKVFLTAFPWVHIRTSETFLEEKKRWFWQSDPAWRAQHLSWQEWLKFLEQFSHRTHQFEAELDLEMTWFNRESLATGRSLFPGVASFMIYVDQSKITITFSVALNLFTETILYVHEDDSPFLTEKTLAMGPAAVQNRQQLRQSLQAWEARSGWPISIVGHDSVDSNERYGFPEAAQQLFLH
jgi:hypothetical protein